MITINEAIFKMPYSNQKNLRWDFEQGGFSHLINKPINTAKKELDEGYKIWIKKLDTAKKIENGKEEPTGKFEEDWRYRQSKELKVIPADEWAKKYAVPQIEAYIRNIEKARKDISKMEHKLKLSQLDHKEEYDNKQKLFIEENKAIHAWYAANPNKDKLKKKETKHKRTKSSTNQIRSIR